MDSNKKYCKTCGTKLAKKNKSGYCKDHCHKFRRNRRETIERNKKAMKGVGNPMFGKRHPVSTIEKMLSNQWDRSGNKNPMSGRHHNKSARAKISKARTGNPSIAKHSDETKRKMRKSAIEYLKNTHGSGWMPRYNKFACKFFDYINKELDLNGQHGENGGEYFVEELGYWLDYIDFDNKIIIENNERKHYQPTRIEKTLTKERELKNYFPDYDIVITSIPRTKEYDEKAVKEIFDGEKRKINKGGKRIP